jgi:hypothetical protein
MINDPIGLVGTAQIKKQGIPVSALAERQLQILIYIAHLFSRITHTLTPAMITIEEIRNAQNLIECNAAHRNPTETPRSLILRQ